MNDIRLVFVLDWRWNRNNWRICWYDYTEIMGCCMTIYINIRNTRSITAICDYGEHHYAGCSISAFEHNHEIENNYYYSCNALPEQQFTPICEYCPGNKHRKYMNEMRLLDDAEVRE